MLPPEQPKAFAVYFSGTLVQEEEGDQVAARRRHCQLANGVALQLQTVRHAAAEASLDCFQRFPGRRHIVRDALPKHALRAAEQDEST